MQEAYLVAHRLELSTPVVGGSAGLHEHRGGFAPSEETTEPLPAQTMAFPYGAGRIRQGHLKHRLCDIDTRLCSVHSDSSLLTWPSGPFCSSGTLVPLGGGVHPISGRLRPPDGGLRPNWPRAGGLGGQDLLEGTKRVLEANVAEASSEP